MSALGPVVGYRPGTVDLHPPGLSDACRGRVWERSRLEWYARDGGDPLILLAAFAQSQGVPIGDLSTSRRVNDASVCGIAVLLAPPSVTATPAPGVPDLVAVAYTHDYAPPPPGASTGAT